MGVHEGDLVLRAPRTRISVKSAAAHESFSRPMDRSTN
jgi:hypothetical protein